MDGTGLLDGSAILEPPLKRIRDCQISELRWSAEHFIREDARRDFVERKHPLREKCEDIVAIRLVLQETNQPRSRLEICGAFLLDEDGVKDVQSCGLRCCVVGFLLDENEQRISQPKNLLPGTFERARRLGLLHAGNFDVHIQTGKIDPFGRTASRIRVTV